MKRIIIHWTAGGHYPTASELFYYHFLIDKDGKYYRGKFRPSDNENCKPASYAPHTGGGNTGSIGVALCGMSGFKNKKKIGNYPITKIQFESAMKLCAELCLEYKIPVTGQTIMTHYEFGLKHPKTSSAGKIDIIFIPPYPWVERQEAGSFIRAKIKWYLLKLKGD